MREFLKNKSVINIKSIRINKRSCPFDTVDIELLDSGSIDKCIFSPENLHIVESNEENFSITSSLEYGFRSCSSIVVHQAQSHIEIIWSGCMNLKVRVIEKALEGFHISSIHLFDESERTSYVITVADASINDVKSRLNQLFFS